MHLHRALLPVGLTSCLVACGDGGGTTTSSDTGSTSTDATSSDATTLAPTTDASATTTTDADTTTSATGPDETSTGEPTTGSDSSAGESSSGTGVVACDVGEWGPECLPCECVNGTCDEGSDGTGACACESGWAGDACDALDCGPGGTPDADGAGCTTPLVVVEDSQVVSDEFSAENYGADEFTPFAVGQQNDFTGNQIGRALLKFDLAELPEGAVVDTASLEVKQYDNFAGFPTTIAARAATSDWSELAVTWDSQPQIAAQILDTSVVGCCGEEHVLDVSPAVIQSLDAAQTELSLVLVSDDEAEIGGVRWFMREGDGVVLNDIVGVSPTLVVHWTLR